MPRPFIIDCGAALSLGYSLVTTYADAIGMTCDWLAGAGGENWLERYPVFASYPQEPFDYAAEDAFFSTPR